MINQVAVFLENKKGRIGDCCRILKEAGVNLASMSIADTQDFGILRLITDNNKAALKTLKENKFIAASVDLVGIEVPDSPGALSDILIALDQADVNIEYLYSFANAEGSAQIGFKTKTPETAEKILSKLGVKLI